jgi:catechol 2,3-dioxygenase-like lactoylglutathione lyase family enzyme
MALDVRGLTPLLQVYDMPTSVRFYRDLLGFEVTTTSPMLGEDRFHWVLLRLGVVVLLTIGVSSSGRRLRQARFHCLLSSLF